jgi:hypothetical protein
MLPWFQRFIFPLPFAMKIIKINLWNQGNYMQASRFWRKQVPADTNGGGSLHDKEG